MKKMNGLLQLFVVAGGAAAISIMTVIPANAYSVTPSGRTAGNLAGQELWDIGLCYGDAYTDVVERSIQVIGL